MKKYSETTIYLSTYAKLPKDMPSNEIYGALDVGIIINYENNEIEDISITLITDETKQFIKQMLVGCSFGKNDFEAIQEKISRRFAGSSQKALCVNLKALHIQYMEFLHREEKRMRKE